MHISIFSEMSNVKKETINQPDNKLRATAALGCFSSLTSMVKSTNLSGAPLLFESAFTKSHFKLQSHVSKEDLKGGYLADDIVAAEPVLVHDGDDDGGLPQHMGGHVEGEGLVEDGVQTALHRHCLLLLYALVLVHQPHLHIWICTRVDTDRAQRFT